MAMSKKTLAVNILRRKGWWFFFVDNASSWAKRVMWTDVAGTHRFYLARTKFLVNFRTTYMQFQEFQDCWDPW